MTQFVPARWSAGVLGSRGRVERLRFWTVLDGSTAVEFGSDEAVEELERKKR
jgi:hypothetical protein